MILRFGRLTAAFLVAVLGVLLSMSVTPASASAPTTSVAAYTYNGHHIRVLLADTTTERGPPVGGYTDTTADDSAHPWSHGALSRPVGPWSHVDTTHDDRAGPVRGVRATATTREQAEVTDRQFVVFDRAGVAAKAGMSAAEAESWAAARAVQLQAQLPAGSAGRVTMGAGVVRDGSGNLIRVVSTSEPNGYLRAGVTLEPGEVLVRGAGHAEADIVKWAADNGYEVVTIGAGRPICPACAGSISGSGGSAATPLKVP